MILSVPKEIKAEENRVALTPIGVGALVAHGHTVLVETDAGSGSGITDDEYRACGARIVSADVAWSDANLVLKVKEPLPAEFRHLREGLIVFTYLHLAANQELTRRLVDSRVCALAYETIQLADGSLPLLSPMSEVAGRLAVQAGAWCLQAENGGRGVLLSGVSGVRPAKVVILGAGIAGTNACQVAVGAGAQVSIMDTNPGKLRYVRDILGGHLTTEMSNRASVDKAVSEADIVIGAVLIPGARAPHLLSRRNLATMKRGAVLVDLAIDQGGCAETSRPTTLAAPIFTEEGIVHYCVTNMPAAVPNTSTYALTNATLSYVIAIADNGLEQVARDSQALRAGVNVLNGHVTHPGVADAMGCPLVDPQTLLASGPA
jgi:alanine dehydrogenase